MPKLTQNQWRWCGVAVLVCASAMAIYAVLSDVLRRTVLVLSAGMSDEIAEAAEPIARVPLVAYWLVFAGMIVLALYLAVHDLRHIRNAYAEERRAILKRTLEDRQFRSALQDKIHVGAEKTSGRNGNSREILGG